MGGVRRPFELDGHACDVRERRGEGIDRVRDGHPGIVRSRETSPGAREAVCHVRRAARARRRDYSAGTAVAGRVTVAVPTVIPSRARAAATSSRAL